MTHCGVAGAVNCALEERISALGGVLAEIASVGWWIDRAGYRGNDEQCEGEH